MSHWKVVYTPCAYDKEIVEPREELFEDYDDAHAFYLELKSTKTWKPTVNPPEKAEFKLPKIWRKGERSEGEREGG